MIYDEGSSDDLDNNDYLSISHMTKFNKKGKKMNCFLFKTYYIIVVKKIFYFEN